MVKDSVKALLVLAAQDDQVAELQRQARSVLKDIDEEMKHLQQQRALVQSLLSLYAGAPTAEAGTIPMPLTSRSVTSEDRDGLPSRERGALVRDTALELARSGHKEVGTRDVLAALNAKGIVFSVKRPASMVGTVLSAMPQFKRLAQDRYAFVDQAGMGVTARL